MQNRNQPRPVAVVVDGVLQVSPLEFSSGLLDLADIQVVRGPQGALYGRGAVAGAIIIDTLAPTNKTEGHFEFGAATGEDHYGEGTISGPLVEDTLFGRLSARVEQRSGYFNNEVLHEKVDPLQDFIVQGRLVFDPSPDVSFDLKLSLNTTHSGSNNAIYQPNNLNPDGTLNLANPFDPTHLDANLVETKYYANYIGNADRTIRSISLRATDNMDWATLSSVTAYTYVEEGFTSDQFPYTASRNPTIGGVLIGDGTQSTYIESSAVSQEVRLTSPSAQRLRWMAGAYFLSNNHYISNSVLTDLEYGLIQLERNPLYGDPLHPTISFLGDDNHDRAWALFGNADYSITDSLELGVALRYDQEHRRRCGRSAGVQDVTKSLVTSNYEVGFKSAFLDNRLSQSGAYFHTDVKNDPFFTFIGAQILIGIDEVRINGGELEAQYRLGGFSANAGLSVTDAKIAKFSLNPSLVGNFAPYVPNVSTSLGVQYSAFVGRGFSLVPRVDYELRGHQYWTPENNTARKALNLFNARLTLVKDDSGLEVAGFVKNLTNVRYNDEWVGGGITFPANPRTYGVSLRYKF